MALPFASTKAEPNECGWPSLPVSSMLTVPRSGVWLSAETSGCGAGETCTLKTVLPEASGAGAALRVVLVVTAAWGCPNPEDPSARTATMSGSARNKRREDDKILRGADCKSKSLVSRDGAYTLLPKRSVEVLYLRRTANGCRAGRS